MVLRLPLNVIYDAPMNVRHNPGVAKPRRLSAPTIAILFIAMGCGGDGELPLSSKPTDAHGLAETLPTGPVGDPCLNEGTAGATATCLAPTQSPDYYVEQAEKYFDTLDIDADPESIPDYSEWVARWEWPPWLLLTGYGREDMILTSDALKEFDPSTVPIRDCRAFEVQPFARCLITFEYEEGPCPIYEEFTFNDAGEMTFIEAWSDRAGLRPQSGPGDPWGEHEGFPRLSTRVPGLGNPQGLLALETSWMEEAMTTDPDLADFITRTGDWWSYWYDTLSTAPDDFFAQGCGW